MILEDTVVFEKLFNLKVVSSEGEFSTLREILLQILFEMLFCIWLSWL